jgi:hypothetical protein
MIDSGALELTATSRFHEFLIFRPQALRSVDVALVGAFGVFVGIRSSDTPVGRAAAALLAGHDGSLRDRDWRASARVARFFLPIADSNSS